MLTQPKVARVLFDESHSEAWTIRRERAERDAAGPPGGLLLRARRRARSPAATSRSLPNADRPLTRDTLAGADVLVIAHPSDPQVGGDRQRAPPRLSDAELDAIEEFVRGGGGLIALGETEQDKYGNNLNELARPLRHRGREPHRAGLRALHSAPSWVLAELRDANDLGSAANGGAQRPIARRPARPRPARLLLPSRDPRPPRRRPGDRPHLPHRLAAARPAGRRRRARRRACRRARRLRPLRRRLHRRARQRAAVAQPRLLGRAARLRRRRAVTDSPAAGRPELARAQARRSRSSAPPSSPTAPSTPPSTTPAG